MFGSSAVALTAFILCQSPADQSSLPRFGITDDRSVAESTHQLKSVKAHADIAAVERQLQTAYTAVSPAIVRVKYLTAQEVAPGVTYGDGATTGIIVSAEGHAVTRGHAYFSNKARKGPIEIALPDGRRVAATALGWSDAWNIELLKISGQGPWPHVAIDASAKARPGDRCIVLDFPEWDSEYEQQPSMRISLVNHAAFPFWSDITLEPRDAGGAVFDLEGRLLGVVTKSMLSGFPTFTGIHVLKERWKELQIFGNTDRTRLESVKRKPAGDVAPEAPEPGNEKRAAMEVANSATVHITYSDRWSWRDSSGVIVTPEGHVISHSHGGVRSPGDMLTMSLSNGRRVTGKLVGFNPIEDLTLIKITDSGPWPHARFGRSIEMKSGTKCIFAGFPHGSKGPEPVIREFELATPEDSEWLSCLTAGNQSMPDGGLRGGDSGGGLFDPEGRLIGIASHVYPIRPLGCFSRVELIQAEWDTLSNQSLIEVDKSMLDVAKSSDPAGVRSPFDGVAVGATSAVVEVLVDGDLRLLGTIVGSDGVVLTKASELTGRPSCRLADGRVFPATIEKELRNSDVAILKTGAVNLPTVRWSELVPRVGMVSAAVAPGKLISAGVVALAERPIPPRDGGLGVILEDSDHGLKVTDDQLAEHSGSRLKKGDIVMKIEGRPTPDVKALDDLIAPKHGDPIAIPGDFVSVEVQRADQKLELRDRMFYRRPMFSQFARSPRRTGFPNVFDISQALERTQCGGPVIDKSGAVIGIVIAAKGHGGTCVVPVHVLRKLLE